MALLIQHAQTELDRIGLTDTPDADEMNLAMRRHLLHMVQQFALEGHSGFSGNYAINLLTQLLRLQPLTELTGEDSEWQDRSELNNGVALYQNARCSRVFKDSLGAYDVNGIEYYTDVVNDDGTQHREYFTNQDSRVAITFPYMPRTQRVEYIEPTAPTTNTQQ